MTRGTAEWTAALASEGRLVRGAWLALAVLLSAAVPLAAQEEGVAHAPERAEEGEGPFERLIIRGATVVDGTGAPPVGPVDVVVEGDRIVEVRRVGNPLTGPREDGRPAGATRELDARGMYVLPGFVDLHAHIGGSAQGTPAEYVYKLWMAHGVTTVRDPGSSNGVDWTLEARRRSERNEIVAPHIHAYALAGSGWDRGSLDTPQKAREWVRWLAERGGDGVKFRRTEDPAIFRAVIDEASEHGLGTAAHLLQTAVVRTDALDAARMGLGTLEHWYGLPEALFHDQVVQDYPREYNYLNEYHRFAEAGRLWRQAADPGSETWARVMEELLELDLVLDPTLTIYEANRDVMRARNAPWHDDYTLPSLWEFFQPSPRAHGSYWYHWTTADEVAWRENYRRWMRFLDEYKDRGGRVCTGSDSGYIYKLYGFGYIRELELLQEAGFHPLEVIRSATRCGAEALARPADREPDFGLVKPGMRADLVVVPENPVEDLKVLYGTGTLRYEAEEEAIERVGGIRWTIKDGIVYDAPGLLEDVGRMVERAK